MPEWESKWTEYCNVLDRLALLTSKLNYMDKVEKRLFAVAYRAAQGTVKDRETEFYASMEYKDFIKERRTVEEEVQALRARRDQLQVWFDLYRTDESTRREEMRLAR